MATSAGRSGSTLPRRRRHPPPSPARPRQPPRRHPARLPTPPPALRRKHRLGTSPKHPSRLTTYEPGMSTSTCTFSTSVSYRDAVTCNDANYLTQCHLASVSSSCHFSPPHGMGAVQRCRSRLFIGQDDT